MSEMTLYDEAGNPLYLNADDRTEFLRIARNKTRFGRTFHETQHWAGCRVSEALELMARRVDLGGNTIAIRSLNKSKNKIIFLSHICSMRVYEHTWYCI